MRRLTFMLVIATIMLVNTKSKGQSFTSKILNKAEDNACYITSNLQDYDYDGDLDIIVGQRNPAGLYWLENEPTKQFPKHQMITKNIYNIADIDTADFDNDGDIDYVVCMHSSIGSNGELVWFQRQLDGTYIKWTISTNKDFIMADVADFNGDGWKDIVAISDNNNTAWIYINQGTLFFNEGIVASDGIEGSVDAADLDNDGDIDIALGGSGTSSENNGARTLINDGKGNFSIGHYLHCWADLWNDCGAKTIRISDLNNDGIKDIMGFTMTGTGGLYWLDGSKDFNQIRIDNDNTIDLGGDFVIFDVDQNGLLDIVRQGEGAKRMSVLYQTSNLRFEREYIELNWDNSGKPTAKMSVGDLDGDGDLDLVFPEKGNVDNDISWFENINGKLYRHYIYSQLDGVHMPKFVDIDNDGDLDIVVTITNGLVTVKENEVLLFENLDGVNFINWRIHDNICFPADIEPADIDGDNDLDLVVTARDENDLVWLENTGTLYIWTYHQIEDNANSPLGCAVNDIDGDGDLDIAVCSWGDDKVLWYENNGKGTFSKKVIAPLLDAPRTIELADFNGDKEIDVAVGCNDPDNSVTIYLNNGTEIFTPKIISTGKTCYDIKVGDWDSDGDLDVVACFNDDNYTTSNPLDILLLSNDGNGNFSSIKLITVAEKVTVIKLSDIDIDGDLDIVMGFNGNNNKHPKLISIGINENNVVNNILSVSDILGGVVYGIDAGDIDNNNNSKEIVYADYNKDNLVLINFNMTTSIEKIINQLLTQIVIFPNPAVDEIYINTMGRDLKVYRIMIYDSSGKELVNKEISSNRNKINIDKLPHGIYFISVDSNIGKVTKKFIKI